MFHNGDFKCQKKIKKVTATHPHALTLRLTLPPGKVVPPPPIFSHQYGCKVCKRDYLYALCLAFWSDREKSKGVATTLLWLEEG